MKWSISYVPKGTVDTFWICQWVFDLVPEACVCIWFSHTGFAYVALFRKTFFCGMYMVTWVRWHCEA